MMSDAAALLDSHLAGLAATLLPYREAAARLGQWGGELAWRLGHGGRLLVAGNGGSAAEAQHLATELVGKLRGDRVPLSAIALGADATALTAIGNDFGFADAFARQVRAHGRPEDVLLLLSSSGRSANLVNAAQAGTELGLRCWALTGPAPNPLAEACADVLAVPSSDPQVVQELHLVSVHLLCEYVEAALLTVLGPSGYAGRALRPDSAPAPTGPVPTGPRPASAAPAEPVPADAGSPDAGPPAPPVVPSTGPTAAPEPSAPSVVPPLAPAEPAPVPADAEPVVPPAGVEVTVADAPDEPGPIR